MGSRNAFFSLLLSTITLICTIFGSGCSGLFYHPTRPVLIDPKRLGLAYETLRFDASDGIMLAGWFFPARIDAPQKTKGTVVQFHGNAENRSTHFLSLAWVLDEGYNLFVFDYRGYGGSEGTPSQAGIYRDGMAALRTIQKKIPASSSPDLILYGQSLGGAILARCTEDMVDRSRVLSVVIEGSFYSYQAIGKNVMTRSFFTSLFQWLAPAWISDQYSPEDSFAKIAPTPLLVIHGDADPVIPISFGEKIFELAKEPKRWMKIPKGKHLNTYRIENGKYKEQVLNYWETLRKASPEKI